MAKKKVRATQDRQTVKTDATVIAEVPARAEVTVLTVFGSSDNYNKNVIIAQNQ